MLTATRFLSNAFRHDPLRSALYGAPSDLAAVLRSLRVSAGHSNKLVRVAAATVVLNAAVLLSGGGGTGTGLGLGAVTGAGAGTEGALDLVKVFLELAVEMIRFHALLRFLMLKSFGRSLSLFSDLT